MTVECGIDAAQVAIGVAFTAPSEFDADLEARVARVRAGSPADEFEARLAAMLASAQQVVVKWRAVDRRIEVVGVLALPGAAEAAEAKPEIHCVSLEAPGTEPRPKEYVELGDLDYPQLLREEAPARIAADPVRTGEFMVVAAQESTELADAMRAKAAAEKLIAEKTVVHGVTDHNSSEQTRVAGAGAEAGPARQVVSGGQSDAGGAADGVTVVSGEASVGGDEGTVTGPIQMYVDKIAELQQRLVELEAGQAEAVARAHAAGVASAAAAGQGGGDGSVAGGGDVMGAPGAEDAAGRAGPGLDLRELISRIWPFRKDREEEGPPPTVPAAAEAVPVENVPMAVPEAAASPGAAPAEPGPDASAQNPEHAAKLLETELHAGAFNQALSKAQKAMQQLQKEQPKLRYIDGMVAELTQERVRIAEMAKRVNVAVRQKELEFRNREHAYQQEIRQREEMLKQKNFALTRMKDQVAQTNMAMERLKSANSAAADDAHYKQKFTHVQKLLISAKEENSGLQGKVEELRSALSAAQFAAKARGPSVKDLQEMKARADKAQRQADEFKRANASLTEKIESQQREFERALAAAKEANKGAGPEEAKRRLEQAMKMITVQRKEAERLTLKVEELEREESRLRRELELARAKPTGGSGGGAGDSAA
jgi:hypothetical protein